MEALSSSEMLVTSIHGAISQRTWILSSKSVCEYVSYKNTYVDRSYEKRELRIHTATDNEVSKNSSHRDSEYDDAKVQYRGQKSYKTSSVKGISLLSWNDKFLFKKLRARTTTDYEKYRSGSACFEQSVLLEVENKQLHYRSFLLKTLPAKKLCSICCLL